MDVSSHSDKGYNFKQMRGTDQEKLTYHKDESMRHNTNILVLDKKLKHKDDSNIHNYGVKETSTAKSLYDCLDQLLCIPTSKLKMNRLRMSVIKSSKTKVTITPLIFGYPAAPGQLPQISAALSVS